MTVGGWVWRMGGSGEDLQVAYLFSWTAQLVCLQGMPAGVGGWVTEMSWEKEAWRGRSL